LMVELMQRKNDKIVGLKRKDPQKVM
jgi:hypothetical protein